MEDTLTSLSLGRWSRVRWTTAPRRRKRVHVPKPLPETGFVRLPDVLYYLGIKKSKWYAGVKRGEYPQPVSLGPNSVAWRAEDIRALIARISAGVQNG